MCTAGAVGANCRGLMRARTAWCTACSPGVQRVHPQWRHCVKLLVKSKSDSYGPAGKCSPVQHQHAAGFCTGLTCNGMCAPGSLTKVYLRYATDRDVKELAKRTKGA